MGAFSDLIGEMAGSWSRGVQQGYVQDVDRQRKMADQVEAYKMLTPLQLDTYEKQKQIDQRYRGSDTLAQLLGIRQEVPSPNAPVPAGMPGHGIGEEAASGMVPPKTVTGLDMLKQKFGLPSTYQQTVGLDAQGKLSLHLAPPRAMPQDPEAKALADFVHQGNIVYAQGGPGAFKRYWDTAPAQYAQHKPNLPAQDMTLPQSGEPFPHLSSTLNPDMLPGAGGQEAPASPSMASPPSVQSWEGMKALPTSASRGYDSMMLIPVANELMKANPDLSRDQAMILARKSVDKMIEDTATGRSRGGVAGGYTGPAREQKAATAGAVKQAQTDVTLSPDTVGKTATKEAVVTGAKTTATIQAKGREYGMAEVQRGQRIFDTAAGKDITPQIGTGVTPFNADTMVSIPQAKAADMQLALARRNSYVALSKDIESEAGKADDALRRGQINTAEWVKRTTGSSVLWKKIAALNDHALTSMRVLTGGAPRSEMMLEISKEAFGNLSPGTSKEVVAQARQNFLIQMDEQIKGYQYKLETPKAGAESTGGGWSIKRRGQ